MSGILRLKNEYSYELIMPCIYKNHCYGCFFFYFFVKKNDMKRQEEHSCQNLLKEIRIIIKVTRSQLLCTYLHAVKLEAYYRGSTLFVLRRQRHSYSGPDPWHSYSGPDPWHSYSGPDPWHSYSGPEPWHSYSGPEPWHSYSGPDPWHSYSGPDPWHSYSSPDPWHSYSGPDLAISLTQDWI